MRALTVWGAPLNDFVVVVVVVVVVVMVHWCRHRRGRFPHFAPPVVVVLG